MFKLIQQLKEAFEQYEYHPATDKQELMFDFFLIASLPQPEDDNLAYVLKDIRKEFYPWMKNHMLHALEFAISSEFRHIFDSNSAKTLTDFFKKENALPFLQKYALYYGALKQGGVLAGVIEVDKIRKELAEEDISYTNSYQALKQTEIDDDIFVLLAKKAFLELAWHGAYGGEPWANIAEAWLKLSEAKEDKDIITYIDHIYDLQHNTDTVFNKLHSYYNSYEGYGWLKKALDYKYNTESLYDLYDLVSPDLKNFASAVIKSATGETLEAWLKKGGRTSGYQDASSFHTYDKVEYTGPREDLKGLKGEIVSYEKGAYTVEFIKPELKEADQKITVSGILPKYLKPLKEVPILDVGDEVKIIKGENKGKIGLISKIKNLFYYVNTGFSNLPYYDSELEKVEHPKSDLPIGKINLGSKIKCINSYGKKALTQGKTYEVVNIYPKSELLVVIGDDGKQHEYKARRFELVPSIEVTEPLKNEFKVGDYIEIVNGSPYLYTIAGSQGQISRIRSSGNLKVIFNKFKEDSFYHPPYAFSNIDPKDCKLIPPPSESKAKKWSNLKLEDVHAGDIVKLVVEDELTKGILTLEKKYVVDEVAGPEYGISLIDDNGEKVAYKPEYFEKVSY